MTNNSPKTRADGTEIVVTSTKSVAADGSLRGLTKRNKKNRASLLLDDMQKQVKIKYGIKNFDPVVMLTLIGMEALQPTTIEVEDDDGVTHTEVLPPDRALAVSAFAKAAPYVRSTLRQIEVTGADDGPITVSLEEKKQQFMERLGDIIDAEVVSEALKPDE